VRSMYHKRTRKPIPSAEESPWLLLDEVAAVIGCSSATAHRLLREEIEDAPDCLQCKSAARRRSCLRQR
jgi:hypothetical protein